MKTIKNEVKSLPKNQLLNKVPAPPVYLDVASKKHWRQIAQALIDAEVLKTIHLSGLEILVDAKSQFEFAVKAINAANKKTNGSGYIQKFSTGAKNVSVELSIKRDATKTMMQCLKQFGLDPKAEKELNLEPSTQLDLFGDVMSKMQKTL
jgi:P27 family predicted phage terminase small subunit